MSSNADDDSIEVSSLHKRHPMSLESAQTSTPSEADSGKKKKKKNKERTSDQPPNPLVSSLEKIAMTERYTKYVLDSLYTLAMVIMNISITS